MTACPHGAAEILNAGSRVAALVSQGALPAREEVTALAAHIDNPPRSSFSEGDGIDRGERAAKLNIPDFFLFEFYFRKTVVF